MNVEVSPVDPFHEHGVEQLEKLIFGSVCLQQREVKVAREAFRYPTVFAHSAARSPEVEAHRHDVMKMFSDQRGDAGAVQSSREAHERLSLGKGSGEGREVAIEGAANPLGNGPHFHPR
jgi:hypothetical protein